MHASKILNLIISLYQRFVSPGLSSILGKGCRFTPTCSEYGKQSIEKYGIFRGSFLTIKRIIRCNPFTRAGYDPVP